MSVLTGRFVARRHGLAGRLLSSFIGQSLAPLSGFAIMPILAHSLGVEGRGAVAAATAPLFLVVSIATVGVPGAVTYTVARHPQLSRLVVSRGMMIASCSALISTVGLSLAAGALSNGDRSLATLMSLAALSILPNLLVAVLAAGAAGQNAWTAVAIERAITNGTRLAGIAALGASHALEPTTAVAVLAISPVLGGCVYLPVLFRKTRTKPVATEVDAAKATALVSYGARMWVGSLTGVLLSRLDQTLMTPLAGVHELGIYASAASIAGLASVANLTVREVIFSAVSARNDTEILTRAARASTAVTALIAVFIAASLPWLVPVLFGDGFQGTVPVTALLLLAMVIGNGGSIAGVGLAAHGRPGLRSTSMALACFVSALSLFLLTPTFGAVGAAAATLLGNAVSGWGCIIAMTRLTETRFRDYVGIRKTDLEQSWSFLLRRADRLRRRRTAGDRFPAESRGIGLPAPVLLAPTSRPDDSLLNSQTTRDGKRRS